MKEGGTEERLGNGKEVDKKVEMMEGVNEERSTWERRRKGSEGEGRVLGR